MKNIAKNRTVWHSSAADYTHTGHLVTGSSGIPWISGGSDTESLLLDLGTVSEIGKISVLWGSEFPEKCTILLSQDGRNFTEAGQFLGASDAETSIELQDSGRYVKLLMSGCSGEHYIVEKLSVFGENDLTYALPALPAPLPSGTQLLTGGNWRLQRAEEVPADGEALSQEGFDDSEWLPAVVPGTALVSYLQAGAIPDPFYDDDQFQNSEEFFTADFWYRDHFPIPEAQRGKHVFLEFDSINWKADVYFNGTLLPNELPGRTHSIEGAFIRAKFDVTGFCSFGEENFLAVRILKNETPGEVTSQGLAYGPGPNGGKLGADNPTIHAAVGWDWLPTIRGRDIGILGDVRLSFGGAVQLQDPWMDATLPLLSESTSIPVPDRMLGEKVSVDGIPGTVSEWHGKTGGSFVVDLGESVPVGSVELIWGTEAGGAAADFESRHPQAFRIEVSEDGVNYKNLDAFPGGKVPVRFMGLQDASENPGTDVLFGHAISDMLPGATANVPLDLSRFGRGLEIRKIVQPKAARFLRFTVIAQRELNGRPVDTIVREMRVYSESPEEVEQSTRHSYVLDTKKAELLFQTELRNYADAKKTVEIRGKILPDGPEFSRKLELPEKAVSALSVPLEFPDPKLWWPNTYGEQNLYTCDLTVLVDGQPSQRQCFDFGVRRFDYVIEGGLLTLYCNGVRIVAKGGNWGLDDGLKRDNRKAYFDKVRLHADQNMTMIRNWVGQTGHPAFYDACDRYGVLIWDDFWLANPVDGPEPNDPELFLQNAADKIRAVRQHPALAFYCGRNEGNPREDINKGLEKLTSELDGTRIYFPHSAALPVGSGGGYSLGRPGEEGGVRQYFNDVQSAVLRSERGIPNVPELESAEKFVRPEHLWPISETWALHDWTYHMNGPANTYMEALKQYIGGDFTVPIDNVQGQAPKDSDPVFRQYKEDIAKMCQEAAQCWSVTDFFRASQLINYDHHRGMFDAVSARLSNGLLMWMSQSSWPSFMWQTYDYYLYENGGFFGAKAGNQPVRAFFDPRNDRILAANATPANYENLTVVSELYNLYGKLVKSDSYPLPALPSDACGVEISTADFTSSDTDLVFLRLILTDADGAVLGENTYWHNRREYQNYKSLREIPHTVLSLDLLGTEKFTDDRNGREMIRTKLLVKNGESAALGARVRILRNGEDVLPAFFSDNYLMMMPQEIREITVEYDADQADGSETFTVKAWNSL